MNTRWLPTRRELALIPRILLGFTAILVPIMFLFSVIAGLDQVVQHRGFVDALRDYGREAEVVVESIDFENGYGYIFLSCPEQTADCQWVYVRGLSFYPSAWLESLKPGQSMWVVYVAARPHLHAGRAVPLLFYPAFQRNPGITPDIWGLFAFFLLIDIIAPHFLFVGLIPMESLVEGALSAKT